MPVSMSSSSAENSPVHVYSIKNGSSQSEFKSNSSDKHLNIYNNSNHALSNNMPTKDIHFETEINNKIEDNCIISQLNILASQHQYEINENSDSPVLDQFEFDKKKDYIKENNAGFIRDYFQIDDDEDISDGYDFNDDFILKFI